MYIFLYIISLINNSPYPPRLSRKHIAVSVYGIYLIDGINVDIVLCIVILKVAKDPVIIGGNYSFASLISIGGKIVDIVVVFDFD